MGPEYYDELIGSTVQGRRWIAAFEVLAGLDQFAERLVRQGSEGLFIIAGGRGTGDPPGPGLAQWRLLETGGASIMEGIRAYETALLDLPSAVLAAIDDFDPDGEARVLRTVFAVDHPVAGRPSYGARPAAWAALENKMIIDDIWDATGVPRAPSEVVAAAVTDLKAAAARLDRGAGTVWVGDNKEGWHGGAEYLRWVRTPDHAAAAGDFLGAHADRARVMPFLDGIPCSIHGMVVNGEVIAFRPAELVILRRPDSGRLFYAGPSTAWDPPDEDREHMRASARDVGSYLRDRFDYRGAFNLDGVLTEEGWLPTELNTRFSAGLGVMQQGIDIPLIGVHWALIEDEELDYRPAELERLLIQAADGQRTIGAGAPLGVESAEQREAEVVFADGVCRFTAPGEERDGVLTLGPSPFGSYLRLRIDPEHHPAGESVAPKAVTAFALTDAEWGTDIGSVEPAPDVR